MDKIHKGKRTSLTVWFLPEEARSVDEAIKKISDKAGYHIGRSEFARTELLKKAKEVLEND